jgi:hypothetical protein
MNAPNDSPSSSASPAYTTPAQNHPAPPVQHTSHARLFAIFAVSLALIIGVVIGVRALFVKPAPVRVCPQDCVAPPTRPPGLFGGVGPGPSVPTALPHPPAESDSAGSRSTPAPAAQPVSAVVPAITPAAQPIQVLPRYPTGSDAPFSVAYPPRANTVSKGKNGVSWTLDDPTVPNNYGSGVARFYGVPANGLTAQAIANQFVQAHFSNAKVVYEIPNAQVGYQSGYGEVAGYEPQSSSGPSKPQRVVILVAVKNGLAAIVEANGPWLPPKDNPQDHGTGTDLWIASGIAYFVNSFRWAGDPPR